MNKPTKGKSIRRQENGRRAIQMFNTQMRDTYPRCGARAKRSGEPCKRFAMANGRCDIHGGKTPSKDGWHRPRWPKKNAPNAMAKLNRKLVDLERAYKQRERRLAAMTDEQRAAYDKWRREHPPGSMGQRHTARLYRRQAAEVRSRLDAPQHRPSSPELEALELKIADLEAAKLILERGSVFD